jgi:hypothetical protein
VAGQGVEGFELMKIHHVRRGGGGCAAEGSGPFYPGRIKKRLAGGEVCIGRSRRNGDRSWSRL